MVGKVDALRPNSARMGPSAEGLKPSAARFSSWAWACAVAVNDGRSALMTANWLPRTTPWLARWYFKLTFRSRPRAIASSSERGNGPAVGDSTVAPPGPWLVAAERNTMLEPAFCAL